MTALLDWYKMNRVERIDLRASQDGEPLYLSMGFIPTHNLRLHLPAK